MEYVDLESGFALMGFAEYTEYKRVKQLCVEKWKPVAFGGEFSRLKEIQALHWVRKVNSGYMDYHHAYQEYQHDGTIRTRPKGKITAKEALATAVVVLGQKCGYEVKYVLVVKK